MIAKVLRLSVFVTFFTLFGMSMTANAATNNVAMGTANSIVDTKDIIAACPWPEPLCKCPPWC